MRSQFEIFIPPTEEAVRCADAEDVNSPCLVEVSNNKPVPILRIDATGLDTRVAQQILEVMVFDGEKVGKFWIDLSITDQHRPRIRVAYNQTNNKRSIQKDLTGSLREPRNPHEVMPE